MLDPAAHPARVEACDVSPVALSFLHRRQWQRVARAAETLAHVELERLERQRLYRHQAAVAADLVSHTELDTERGADLHLEVARRWLFDLRAGRQFLVRPG